MRLASIVWRSPAPTSVDEELALYDDGAARLVVRSPRNQAPAIGTYTFRPAAEDADELAKLGPDPRFIDLLAHEQPLEHLFPMLGRLREAAIASPEAIATFHGRALELQPGAGPTIMLAVVAAGTRPVEFELNPERCAVHFFANSEPLTWQPFPHLETGFIDRDANGFGGVRRTAIVPPESYGVITVPIEVPEGADALSIQVVGTLRAALPDAEMPEHFETRTETAALGN